jgi:beta-fructofuranosidase
MLSVADHWLWDSWIVDDGELYHMYALQAPRSLEEGWRRHTAARIGHATSPDLKDWTYHGVALGPGPQGSWDDLAIWTGSTVRGDDGVWRMFYTAVNTGGLGVKDQKIGVVKSDDLFTWRRERDTPLLEANPDWYMTLGLQDKPNVSETWRDPYVFRDPDGDGWHMYLCVREPGAPRLDDGVIGYARSWDLDTWELQPPINKPAGFGQIEVPQVGIVDGQPTLVFTCHWQEQPPETIEKWGPTKYCTWSIPGDSLLGPWDISKAVPFEAEPELFAAPFLRDRSGQWVLVGFVNLEPYGILSFDIIDPIPVVSENGVLKARADYVPVGPARLASGK